MNVIGLDIGTTTICGIAINTANGEVLKKFTEKNDSVIINCKNYEKLQDPQIILSKVTEILEKLIENHSPVASIGITGQMHGILYVNGEGEAISPLYTWQDESANQPLNADETYAEFLTKNSGYNMASGFGLSTLFVHTKEGNVPENAAKISTIHDYVAMRLGQKKTPVTHPSDGASLGIYDVENNAFDEKVIKSLGMDVSLLPTVGNDGTVIGEYKGIPIAVAIGDNQASFIGSVPNMKDSLLINIGTGSQVSLPAEFGVKSDSLEQRPCTDDTSILVGSALCGGRAFAATEKFFRDIATVVTGCKCESAYFGIDKLLEQTEDYNTSVEISTKFCGTRKDPNLRGSVTNLGLDNFTPKDFLLGVMNGIVSELYEMVSSNGADLKIGYLVGSGNGLRQNPALRRMFEERFGMQMVIPKHMEEAAYGAAIFALAACKVAPSLNKAQALIKYC